MTRTETIADTLFEALTTADEKDLKALNTALQAYRTETNASFGHAMRNPIVNKLFNAINEACECCLDDADHE